MKMLSVMMLAATMQVGAAEWQEVWREDFNGAGYDTNVWERIPQGKSDWNRNMSLRPDLVEVKDGNLVLWGKRNTETNADPRACLTGGIWTKGLKAFGLGKIEIRARFEDHQQGAWPAFWTVGDKRFGDSRSWPWNGEIDIVERLNGDPFVYQTVHTAWTYREKQDRRPPNGSLAYIRPGEYNVYGLEIATNALIWSVNGVETFRYARTDESETQWPFACPQDLRLDMQLGGNWVGDVDLKTLPVSASVDWVRFSRRVAEPADVLSTDYPTVSAAIAACAEKGGGRVRVPEGTYETGPVHLRSNVELHLEDGAKLVFPDDEKAYLPAVPTSWEGVEVMGYSPLVYCYGVTNAAITGKGQLCAKVRGWLRYKGRRPDEKALAAKQRWGRENAPLAERDITRFPESGMRPHFLQLNRCRNVRLEGFSMRGSPFWMTHVYRCEAVTVRGLDLCAWTDDGLVMNNSDGLDIEMSKNVLVEYCTFRQNDDAICLKAGKDEDGRRNGIPCEDVTIRRCNVDAGHGLLVIGCEVSAGVRNVRLYDCTVNAEVNRLVFLKTTPARGGFIENVVVDGIRAKKVLGDGICLETRFYVGQPGEELPGARPFLTRIDGLTVRNVHCEWVKRLVTLLGEPLYPATNVRLENVRADVAFERFVKVENVDGVKLDVESKKVFPDAQW